MKTSMMSIFCGLVLLNSASSFAGTVESSRAWASEDASICDKINLDGIFKSRGNDDRVYELEMSHKGCLVTVEERVFGSMEYPDKEYGVLKRDLITKKHWQFDLTGNTKINLQLPTEIPSGDETKSNEVVFSEIELSPHLTVEDTGNGYSISYIELRSRIKIPKNSRNPFDVYLTVSGKIDLHTYIHNGASSKIYHLSLSKIKTRLLKIENSPFPTAALGWFVSGANYVLQFLDDVNVGGTILPALKSLERTNKRIKQQEPEK